MNKKKAFGFRHAMRGVYMAVVQEPNMRVYLVIIALVLLAGFVCGLERWAWVAILVCFALVISAELLNTCVERICDKITTQRDGLIRDIKDMAAGAVFVCALLSVGVAVLVFCRPEVFDRLTTFFQ